MKIIIAVLVLLLIGVSGFFYIDHVSLTQKNTNVTMALAKMQQANIKQAATIKTLLTCVNITENTYKTEKQFTSPATCIKSRLVKQS
jgi:hypothetical protein